MRQGFVQSQKRHFQFYGREYMSGLDRTLLDKLNFAGIQGYWFALFGIGNLAAYGLHLFLRQTNYQYHFAYKGESRMFTPIKAMLGSESLANVIWTAPSLIGLNIYLH